MSESISSDLIRGHIETIVLGLLFCEDLYGYEMSKIIAQKSNFKYEIKETTLYSSFKRLEKNNFIQSYWGDNSQGGRRKYYAITDAGRDEFQKLRKMWIFAKEIIDIFVM